MADERAEQVVQELYNKATKQPAIEQALMVMASFGAMMFLPDLVQRHRQRLVAVHRVDVDRPVSIEVAHSTVMRMLDQVHGGSALRCRRRRTHAHQDRRGRRRCRGGVGVRRLRTGARARRGRAHERLHGSQPGVGAVRRRRCSFACFQPALGRLMAALAPIVTDAARSRIARGELSFDDLLVLTRRLLQTQRRRAHRDPRPPPPPVRRRVPGHRSGAVRRASPS